jgi:hypothetical protein
VVQRIEKSKARSNLVKKFGIPATQTSGSLLGTSYEYSSLSNSSNNTVFGETLSQSNSSTGTFVASGSLESHSTFETASDQSGINIFSSARVLTGGKKIIAAAPAGERPRDSHFLTLSVNEHAHMYEGEQEYECSVLPAEGEYSPSNEVVLDVPTDNGNTSVDEPTSRERSAQDHLYNRTAEEPQRREKTTKRVRRKEKTKSCFLSFEDTKKHYTVSQIKS